MTQSLKIIECSGHKRLVAILAAAATIYLSPPPVAIADVWTSKVVNGWTYQSGPAGASLAAGKPDALANVQDDTDAGALSLTNAWSIRQLASAQIFTNNNNSKKWFSVYFGNDFPASGVSLSTAEVRVDYAGTNSGAFAIHLSTNRFRTRWYNGVGYTNRSFTNSGFIAYDSGVETGYVWDVSSFLNNSDRITNCEVLIENSSNSLSANLYFDYFQLTVAYTPLTAPVVTNDLKASEISTNSARLNGRMVSGGPAPHAWFYWGTNDPGQTTEGWGFTNDMGDREAGYSFSNDISGLLAGQTYYYRCAATNIYGTNWDIYPAVFTTLQAIAEFNETASNGVESSSPVILPVTLSATSGVPVSIRYSVVGGTASSGDFTLTNGTLTIPPGQTVGNISMSITNDTMDESNETVIVSISNAVGAVLGINTQLTYTIDNDDPQPFVYFTNTPFSILESLTNATVTVALSQKSGKPVVVDYWTSDGSASNTLDYTATNGTLSWSAGDSSAKSVIIAVSNDINQEGDETFVFNLAVATPSNCTIQGSSTANVRIVDDDNGPPVVDNEPPSNVSSNSARLNGYLQSTGGAPTSVWIYWGSQDGGTTKTSWVTNQYLGIRPINPFGTNVSGLVKNTQYWYRCYASNFNGGAWAQQSTNFLTGPPTVQFASATTNASETNTPGRLQLRLTAPSTYGLPVTVNYSAISGTASNGTDYILPASNITITAGSSYANIDFSVTDDSIFEDDETIRVAFSNVQNAIAGPNTNCIYTIVDNDPPPTVSFMNAPYSVMENGVSIAIPVALSTNTERIISIAYATSDGTAQAGREYTTTNGIFYWQRGQGGTNTFVVPIIDNGSQGGNRSFYLTLSSPSNCTISGNSFTNVVIREDDNVAPVITNRGASNIQWTTATLNGFVTTSYPPATAFIYWGPTDGGSNFTAWSNVIVIGSTPGLFSAPVAGLVANKAYYFRCFATNNLEPASFDWANTTTAFTTAPPWVAGVSNYYVNDGITAGDLYCSATGRVANAGTSNTTPKASVQAILDIYNLNPGDVIWIDSGRYILAAPLSVAADDGGSAGSKVVLRGTTGEGGSVLDLGGGGGAVVSLAASHVRIENLAMTGGDNGLYAESCAGIQVVGCNTCSNTTDGIYLYYCTENPVVSNTLSFNNGLYGIYLDTCTGGTLWGNDCYYNGYCGIRILDTMGPAVIENSCHGQTWADPWDPLGTGILVSYSSLTSTGESIVSNRCYENPFRGIDLRYGESSIVSGNVCWSNTYDGLNLTAANLFAVGNVSYANQGVGMSAVGSGVAAIRNNLLFSNSTYQLDFPEAGYAAMVENNTICGGYGVHFLDPAMVTNRNNIIWADGSGAVGIWLEWVPAGSEILSSDYNNLYATGGANVGASNNPMETCSTLADWTNSFAGDTHSVSTDPRFVDASAYDFHLQSPAGSYHDGTWQGDPAFSPCIDAGDPWSRFTNETHYNGLTVNLGAYGNTREASRTVYSGPFFTVSMATQPVSAGWASIWPLASDCITNSQYPTNRLITISSAVTNEAYLWDGWKGSIVTNAETVSFFATGTMSLTASFTSKVFAITSTAYQGGAISPSGIVSVAWGSNRTFSISNFTGYSVSNVFVDEDWKGPTNSWTFSNVTGPHSIQVWFRQATSIVTATAGPGGSIVPSGAVVVPWSSNQTFQITTNAGYAISNVVVDSSSKGVTNGWTFLGVTNNHLIEAWFQPLVYSITATARLGGVISPSGTVSVMWGSNQTFAVSNAAGYSISNILVDGSSNGPVSSWTFTNVTAAHTIEAWFQASTSVITATAGPGGTISPSGAVVVAWSSNQTFTITTNAGYMISNVVVDTVSRGVTNSWTFNNVTNNHVIEAWFQTVAALTIAATAGPGGSITPSGTVPVEYGSNQTFTIATNLGFMVSNVVVDSVSKGVTNSWTFNDVTNNGHTIDAWFQPITYSITATAGTGGVISPSGTVSVIWGSNQTFAISNAIGYSVSNVLVDGSPKGPISSWTFTNVTAGHAIEAWFRPATSVVTAAAGPGGGISPSGSVVVAWTSNQTFTITNNYGYVVSNVVVDSVSRGITNGWTFTNVTNNHSIDAWFRPATSIVTASAGPGGGISPSGAVVVAWTSNQTFTITNNYGYMISNVVVDSVSRGVTNGWTFTNVTGNHSIDAWFQPVICSITATAGIGGIISPSGTVSVVWGSNQVFAVSNGIGYTISNIVVDGSGKGPTNSWLFTNVTANHSIEAWFRPATSIITATAGPGGSITPSGIVVVAWTSNQTFTITTNFGFVVSNVMVDSTWQGATNSWTFSGVTNDHTIAVWFKVPAAFTTNGTPYAWLQSHGYTQNYDTADWSDDDNDRSFAWQEYQAGTVPTNALSVFKVLRTDRRTASNLVSWYATTNSGVTTYMILYRSTNLRYSAWIPWASNIARSASGTNNWWDTNLPPAGVPFFYRPSLTNQGWQ